ncbi:cryptochrome/photolyase family protein [Desertivirga xinjiangensis]|uniref:cryptochrome/photolyase family protein n=1 Tax=Desertivirga xinjiangensis TaxID=539206 RepID=UPI00210AE6D8|nr:deoxyribodipyrimidine photo-lyase [Pedobacter xinjiangensis]
MLEKKAVSLFWFRRDLRLDDNAGLYHALKSEWPVMPLFIFDQLILSKLEDKDDARVSYIYEAIDRLNADLRMLGSSLLVKHSTPALAWQEILAEFNVRAVFTNNDYEPYGRSRDQEISALLKSHEIPFYSFKDHLIFEKDEIIKENNSPYTVFTPYKRKWLEKLNDEFHFKAYSCNRYHNNFSQDESRNIPSLKDLGFTTSSLTFPLQDYKEIIEKYKETRDFPAVAGTTLIGVHLRFGTISIRQAARAAFQAHDKTWLSELIWRDFYAMILWHFPYSAHSSFKKLFDKIIWRNNEQEFEAWCTGTTGYPIVDAGMRQLNATGWMHNRVRMITASFLCKHLLIDWRWGEAYFARKLIDYDQASNVGGWQWAAGTGNDAAPYFRVFSPDLQTKRFDPHLEYIRKWIPEFDEPFSYPQPIVEHRFARERALEAYKRALQ